MNLDLAAAKQQLIEGGYTCVLCKDGECISSTLHGVRAPLSWVRENRDLKDFSAADQVVGKAAAFLYVKLGIREIYAKTISDEAIGLLEKSEIPYCYDSRVPQIRNRDNTDMCPMERAVLEIFDPDEAYHALREAARRMRANAFEFRSILPEEAEQAARIEQVCFPPNEACSPQMMRERVMRAPDLFLVAVDKASGKIAGFLNGLATDERVFRDEFFTDASLHQNDGSSVMLCGLDVLPEYRGQGLARTLVENYTRREQKKGRERLVLTCLESKVEMYRKLGFTDLGTANSSWGGEQWHEMEKPIFRVRRSQPEDLDRIMDIYAYARKFMAEHGNPRQWGPTNWPPEDLIREDIRKGDSYVCISYPESAYCSGNAAPEGRIAGVFYFISGEDIEPTYRVIDDGEWIRDGAYGVVHRIASDGSVPGVGRFCINWAYRQCRHLRIDTHDDNKVMQNLLTRLGFSYCGTIYVYEDHDPRRAYEK